MFEFGPHLMQALTRSLAHPPKGAGRTGLPVAWASSRGLSRKDNQDRLLVGRVFPETGVAIVADGMGGMRDGARAASIAIAAAVAHLVSSTRHGYHGKVERLVAEALAFANEQVFRALHGEGGATLVMAVSTPDAWHIGHAGDARAYHVLGDLHLKALTSDDTLNGQLHELGKPVQSGSALHSQLLQFIGSGKEFEPHVSRVPPGGRGLLLTTDGAHSLPLEVLEWIVSRATSVNDAAERIVTASEWDGGKDNATVVAVSFQGQTTRAIDGLAEFWLPGEHVIVPGSAAPSRVAESPSWETYEPTNRARKGRRKRSRAGAEDGSSTPGRHEEPIVQIMADGDAVPAVAVKPEPAQVEFEAPRFRVQKP